MKKNILALDIGTQSVRAAVVDADGQILGIAQTKHEVDSPQPGWAQQRPDAWWDETCRAIRGVLAATGVAPESIAAVSTCGQMHGPVGVDEDGAVTTDWVQLWCDKRCGPQCDAVRANGDQTRLAELSGNPINPAWIGLKVRWYKENRPEAYERARWFLVPKDFINYRLTGVAATDPSVGGPHLHHLSAVLPARVHVPPPPHLYAGAPSRRHDSHENYLPLAPSSDLPPCLIIRPPVW